MNRIFWGMLSLALGCGCSHEKDVYDQTPAQRIAQHVSELQHTLTSQSSGWHVVYFPRVDSLLNTQISTRIMGEDMMEVYRAMGYGGVYCTMTFTPEGKISMLADYDDASATTRSQSSYEIALGSQTQLSLRTYSYLHRLVGSGYRGSSDFVYLGKDFEGHLRFASPSYAEPARDYIAMMPLESTAEDAMLKAVENRQFFERMKNPQIRIHQGDRDYFRSDAPSRSKVTTNLHNIQMMREHRYAYFHMITRVNSVQPEKEEYSGLGSGYVGTPEGLSFRPGFRLSPTRIFYDFVREGDRFCCELVEVYDPLLRKTSLASRHLHPEGRVTGLVAEIWDDK